MLIVCSLWRGVASNLAAPEDRNAVSNLKYFVQLMGDEDDARPSLCEATNNLEELLGLLRRKHCGRLIKDEDVALPIKSLKDLYALANANRKIFNASVKINVKAVLFGKHVDARTSGRLIKRPKRSVTRLSPKGDRFNNVKDRDEHEVLMDHADPGGNRLCRVLEVNLYPVDQDLA